MWRKEKCVYANAKRNVVYDRVTYVTGPFPDSFPFLKLKSWNWFAKLGENSTTITDLRRTQQHDELKSQKEEIRLPVFNFILVAVHFRVFQVFINWKVKETTSDFVLFRNAWNVACFVTEINLRGKSLRMDYDEGQDASVKLNKTNWRSEEDEQPSVRLLAKTDEWDINVGRFYFSL